MAEIVTVVGLKDANRALKQLPDLAKGEVQAAMDTTAFQVSRAASAAAPISSDGSHGRPRGFLRRSIQWASRPRSVSAVVGISFDAFYWKFLEYGTRFMAARPFLRPAADKFRDEHLASVQNALTRAGSKMAALAKHV